MAIYRDARKSTLMRRVTYSGLENLIQPQGLRFTPKGSKVPCQQGCQSQGSKARPEEKRQMTRGKFSFSVSRQNFSGFLLGRQFSTIL